MISTTESDKAAIVAEIEENLSADGVGNHQLKIGNYHEKSFGSKVLQYTQNHGLDIQYSPIIKNVTISTRKSGGGIEIQDTHVLNFMQYVEGFEEIDWYSGDDDESDSSSAKEKLLSLKLTLSPFDAFAEYLRLGNYTLAQCLGNINLVSSFSKNKRRPSRKDRKRERRDKESKDFDRSTLSKFRKDRKEAVAELDLPLEAKLLRERNTIAVGKAIAEKSLSAFLSVMSLLLHSIKDLPTEGLDSHLLPVGNLIASLFEVHSEVGSVSEQQTLLCNPFRMFIPQTKRTRSKSVTNSDISKYDVPTMDDTRDEVLSQIGNPLAGNVSDAGSTIGSTYADLGTETASIMGDEMNEEEILAHALALSMGESVPLKGESYGKAHDGYGVGCDEATLDASTLEYAELLNSQSGTHQPFSTVAPFKYLEFWSSIYGTNVSKRIAGNLVPVRCVIVALMASINICAEKRASEDSFATSKSMGSFSHDCLDHSSSSRDDYSIDFPITSTPENICAVEFLVDHLKQSISLHCQQLGNLSGDSSDTVRKLKEWYVHLYLLVWLLKSLLRLCEELLSKSRLTAPDSAMRAPFQHSSSAFGSPILRAAFTKLRGHFADIAGLSNNLLRSITSKFQIRDLPDLKGVTIRLGDLSGSIFADSVSADTLLMDYRFCVWNFNHVLRLSAIDTFLSGIGVFVTDSVSRFEITHDMIQSATSDSEHVLFPSLKNILLGGLQEAIHNGDEILLSDYSFSPCKEEVYQNYFLQRLCSETIKADEILLPYYHTLTTAAVKTRKVRDMSVEDRYAAALQKLMRAILMRLDKRSLSSNFYGNFEEKSASRLWGELDFIRTAQLFVFDTINHELETYWAGKGLIYQEFSEDRSHPSLIFSDDMKVVTHIGPRVWSSVLGTTALEPGSGIYEWTTKVDRCSKGHVFLGIATSDASTDKDAYIGVDRTGWGLIGTRSLWHNKSKVLADFGSGFSSGSIVTVIYDSDLSTLSFRGDGVDWGLAFENLPKQRLFPAFSLHEKGDQISILRCIRKDSSNATLKSRGNSLDVRTETWPGFFAEYCQSVLVMSDKTVSNLSHTGEERLLLSPIVTTLSASLIAYIQSPRFSYLADSPIVVSILPFLSIFSRRLANLAEKLVGKKSMGQITEDLCQNSSSEPSLYGMWHLIFPSNSTVYKWLLEVPLAPYDSFQRDESSKSLRYLFGKSVWKEKSSYALCGMQDNLRFKINEMDDSGSTKIIDGRVSLCGGYFCATQMETKTGRITRLEGYLMKHFTKQEHAEKTTIKKLALLAFSACSFLSGKLVGDSISSDRFKDIDVDENIVQFDESSFTVQAEDSDKPAGDESLNRKRWPDSILFSGGISLSPRNLESILKFLAAYLSKYSPPIREIMLGKMSSSYEETTKANEEYLSAWIDFALPIKSDLIEDVDSSKMSVEGLEVESDEAQFYSSFLAGKVPAATLDDYISMYVGQSAVLKLGGAIMNRTRKMVIVALVQHSGCFLVCEAESAALALGQKQFTDRPVCVLLEIWRAAMRVIETIIRLKQETGDSYDVLCKIICRKAEFLGQIDPNKASSSVGNSFLFLEKHQIINDRWYLETGLKIHNTISKLIAEITEFFTSPITHVDAFYSKLVERSADAFLRMAGFKSYLYLLGKVDREWQKLSLFSNGGSLHDFHTMGLAHLPVFRQNAVVMNAQQHYGSGLKGVCVKIKAALQYSFEQLYEVITQHLTKSTWSKDREGQFAALKAWNIVIQPDDHLFLNRMNLFRTLHTVLDDVRNFISSYQSEDYDEISDLGIVYSDLINEQREFLGKLKTEYSMGRHKALAQLILDTVHSLATQIAGSTEHTVDEFDLGAAHLLRRTSSGPDTLSRSLFDLMFSEYLNAIKPIILNALEKQNLEDEHKKLKTTGSAEENRYVVESIEGEDYIYRILKLLKMVSQSDSCRKILCSIRWLSGFVGAIGFGACGVQRRIFRLLRKLLADMDPSKVHVLVPKFFEPREILKLDSSSENADYLELNDDCESNSLGLIPKSGADGIVCFLLECVSLMVPCEERQRSFTAFSSTKGADIVISSESLFLLRVLYGIPAWRKVIQSRFVDAFAQISTTSGGSSTALYVAMVSVLGGAFDRRRIGGLVTIRPFCLLTSNEMSSNRTAALSHGSGLIVSYASSTSNVEIALLDQKVQLQNEHTNLKVTYGMEGSKNQPIKIIRLNLSDTLPASDIPIISATISFDFCEALMKRMEESAMKWAKISTSGAEVEEKPSLSTLLAYVSSFKALSVACQNFQNAERIMLEWPSLFANITELATKDAGSMGLASLESLSEKFSEILLSSMPPRSSGVSPAPFDDEQDFSRQVDRAFTSNQAPSRAFETSTNAETNLTSPLRDLAAMLSPSLSRGLDPNMQSAALSQMLEMGLPREWCEFSLRRCHYNVEMAINMCLEHGADMAHLIAQEAAQESMRTREFARRTLARDANQQQGRREEGQSTSRNDPGGLIRQLIDMGFPPSWCARALESSQSGNLDSALGWILTHDDELMSSQNEEGDSESSEQPEGNAATSSAEVLVFNPLEVVSGSALIKPDLTCSTPTGGFPSVGCKAYAVTSGKWYYELTVLGAGCVQVGWASSAYTGGADNGQGVGDDVHSWAYDGWRTYLWHEAAAEWGARWCPGDVVGCSIDFDNQIMSFTLNGHGEEVGMGKAFSGFGKYGVTGIYPCVSFNRNESVRFNFGSTPFKYPSPDGYLPYSAWLDQVTSHRAKREALIQFNARRDELDAVSDENEDENVNDKLGPIDLLSSEKVPSKRFFKNDEPRQLTAESTNFFNASIETCKLAKESDETIAKVHAVAQALSIMFSRLIVLRCMRCVSSMSDGKQREAFDNVLGKSKSEWAQHCVSLLQKVSGYSNRTKSYQLLQSVQSSAATSMANLGSVFCAGGFPALFEVRGAIVQFIHRSIQSNNPHFLNVLLKAVTNNLALASSKESSGKWITDVTQFPVIMRDISKTETEDSTLPSLVMAHFSTSLLASTMFALLKSSQTTSFQQSIILSSFDTLLSSWCSGLRASSPMVKLVCIRMLSNLVQELIVSRKDSWPLRNLSVNTSILQSIQRACLFTMESHSLTSPIFSEHAISLLELGAASKYFYDTFAAHTSTFDTLHAPSLDNQPEESAESEDPMQSWEVRTGRAVSSGSGWDTWTGTVVMQSFSLPGGSMSFRGRGTERQEGPPELMPGCKVLKPRHSVESGKLSSSSNDSSPGNRVESEFTRWIRDQSNSSAGDSISRLRMMFAAERERESDRESDTRERSPFDSSFVAQEESRSDRLGTVLRIETWPGTSEPGNARRVKWDDDETEELVRWGAEGAFDVIHCQVKQGKVTQRYTAPPTLWQKLANNGFGNSATFGIILRLRYKERDHLHSTTKVVAHIEWPDFSAIVFATGTKSDDGTIHLIEERLISGASHCGWEARFGSPSWSKGTKFTFAVETTQTSGRVIRGSCQKSVEVCRKVFTVGGSVTLQQTYLFAFDDRLHAGNIALSVDATSAAKQTGGGQGCALGNVGFSSGVHFWEFKVEQADIGSIFIGVSEKPSDIRSIRLTKWQGCGIVNNRSSYKTSPSSLGERANVYGDHFQSGDIVGVILDLNHGKISFYLDGMKYGEHILADLGYAFDNLIVPNSVKPKTYYPIVGLSKPMDRITQTRRWFSIPGCDSTEQYQLFLRSFQLLYSWNLERTQLPLKQHMWIYHDGWHHFNRWRSNAFYRTKTRCNLGSVAIILNKSNRECVLASLNLGLSHPLLHGDRVVFTKSSGKSLDAKEEAIIVGSYNGYLWYKRDAQVAGGDIIETGADAWFLVPNDVEGMSIVKRADHGIAPEILDVPLPRTPGFHGGFLRIYHETGAVMRDGLEIDTSEVICTIPAHTTVFAIERRTNSSNINRYLVHFNGNYGWISERMRGGSEEIMLRWAAESEIHEDIDDLKTTMGATCKINYVRNRLFQQQVGSTEEALAIWEKTIAASGTNASLASTASSSSAPSPSSMSFEEYLSLSSTMDGHQAWTVEADMQLSELISKLAQQRNMHPLNISVQDLITCVESNRDNIASSLQNIDALRVVARAAILREANLVFSHTLPYFNLEVPEERDLSEVFGSDSVIEIKESTLPALPTGLASEDWSKYHTGALLRMKDIYREVGHFAMDTSDITAAYSRGNNDRSWAPSSLSRRLRLLRRLLFSQTKLSFWESIIEATTTTTPLHQDEYEDPREIKAIKINRIKATISRLSTLKNSTERVKQSVFGQLHKEIRGWANSAYRRSYIGKGHGGQKRAFKVKFVGEGVNDYGGPYRAVFEQIVDELRTDSVTAGGSKPSERCLLPLLIPCTNRTSAAGSNQDKFLLTTAMQSSSLTQELMTFFGKLVGLSVRHHMNMPLDMSAMVWRPLVRLPVSLAHLETVDNFTARNLKQVTELGERLEQDLLQGKISAEFVPEEWMDLNFAGFLPDGSKVPLLPGGEDIAVNVRNWRDYVQLTERLRLQESANIYKSFREGIAAVLPVELFPLFTATELEQLICGNSVVDIDLIRRCAEYEDMDPQSPFVAQFWEVLKEMTDEERTLFLRFVWARSRMPASAKDFPMNFKLQRIQGLSPEQNDGYLPHAQTCFFSLALPMYSSKELLREKLLYAIKNSPNMDADVRLHTAEGWGDS